MLFPSSSAITQRLLARASPLFLRSQPRAMPHGCSRKPRFLVRPQTFETVLYAYVNPVDAQPIFSRLLFPKRATMLDSCSRIAIYERTHVIMHANTYMIPFSPYCTLRYFYTTPLPCRNLPCINSTNGPLQGSIRFSLEPGLSDVPGATPSTLNHAQQGICDHHSSNMCDL